MNKCDKQDYPGKDKPGQIPVCRYFAIITAIWTSCILGSLAWNINHEKETTVKMAIKEARASFNRDQAIRLWAASRGGVYIPADSRTPPNPHLSHISERDIKTPSGRQLTLANPAYMLRLVMDEYPEQYGIKGHITSLKPLWPANAPDQWERKALKSFEEGVEEAFEITEIDGKSHVRLMRPLITREKCLKCHGFQGYKAGDVRGGIGVSVPLEPLQAIESQHISIFYLSHVLIWALGITGILIGTLRIKGNIDRRNRAEECLRESEEKYRALFESNLVGVAMGDKEGRFLRANDAFQQMIGYREDELHDLAFRDLTHPDDLAGNMKLFGEVLEKKRTYYRMEKKYFRKDGSILWGDLAVFAIYDDTGEFRYCFAMVLDITERKTAEKQIEASLEEKEVLLKEIHHRVKNNMQIISSLLSLQSSFISDKYAKSIFDVSRNRIRSMALVHEKLYMNKSLANINIADYVTTLVGNLLHTYAGRHIAFKPRINVDSMDIDTLIPCGLIINEVVSNSLKHAFPDYGKGEITISLVSDESNTYTLEISDNGRGMPQEIDIHSRESLGLLIVNTLVAQLDGKMELDREGGTTIRIVFTEDKGP